MNSQTRWAFHLPDWKPTLQQMNLVSRCIQPEERIRISKFHFQRDAKASLVGRLMMRKYCSEILQHPYDALKFGRDENNKPILESPKNSGCCFNVSHQGNYVVLAGSPATNVGVDVMEIEERRDTQEFFRLMTRQFSPLEWSKIKSYRGDALQMKAFVRNWSLKEAYVKAVGTGIVFELERIDFIVKSELDRGKTVNDTQVKVDMKLLTDWRFEEAMLDDKHVVAVAVDLNSPVSSASVAVKTAVPWTSNDLDPENNTKFEIINFDELVLNAMPFGSEDLNFCEEFLQKHFSPKSLSSP